MEIGSFASQGGDNETSIMQPLFATVGFRRDARAPPNQREFHECFWALKFIRVVTT